METLDTLQSNHSNFLSEEYVEENHYLPNANNPNLELRGLIKRIIELTTELAVQVHTIIYLLFLNNKTLKYI